MGDRLLYAPHWEVDGDDLVRKKPRLSGDTELPDPINRELSDSMALYDRKIKTEGGNISGGLEFMDILEEAEERKRKCIELIFTTGLTHGGI